LYLTQSGAKVVGIIDRAGGIISVDGLGVSEVKDLFFAKKGNSLESHDMMSFEDVNAKIWDLKADIFLPCAGSRLVNQDQVDRLLVAGVSVISSGANVPFADNEIFYGAIAESADKRIAVIPDFIANCGMARVFAYLMSDGEVDMSDEAIFSDTSEIIRKALLSTFKLHPEKNLLTATAFEKALKTLSK
jgi:glutamate dehydrogenase/leucine dehydrogenase